MYFEDMKVEKNFLNKNVIYKNLKEKTVIQL